MKRLILTAVLIASPAIAETVDVYVVDEGGDGVVQYESDTTVAESSVLIDGERPSGAMGVVLEKGKPVHWTDLTPEEINERHGGTGEPPIVNLDDDEMEFDEKEEQRSQTQDDAPSDIDFENTQDLMPEPDSMQSTRIQPRDGYWIIEIQDQTFAGCPAGIEAAANAQMAALQSSGNRGIFGPDFAPEQMAPQLDWTQIGTNSWFGSHDMTQNNAGVFLQWGVQVISPTLINHRQQLNFLSAGLGNCEVNTFVQAGWVN